jgi:hypothetical protein
VADKFDPYREAQVVEIDTVWPAGVALTPAEKVQLEERLHSDAANCANLEYIRVHTGFCRKITATPEDIERVQALAR